MKLKRAQISSRVSNRNFSRSPKQYRSIINSIVEVTPKKSLGDKNTKKRIKGKKHSWNGK